MRRLLTPVGTNTSIDHESSRRGIVIVYMDGEGISKLNHRRYITKQELEQLSTEKEQPITLSYVVR